jgi:hypothetical protein
MSQPETLASQSDLSTRRVAAPKSSKVTVFARPLAMRLTTGSTAKILRSSGAFPWFLVGLVFVGWSVAPSQGAWLKMGFRH